MLRHPIRALVPAWIALATFGLVLGIRRPGTWHWAYFLWGLGVGIAATVVFEIEMRRALRLVHDDEARARMSAVVSSRRLVTEPGLLITCSVAGAGAASFDAPWIDWLVSVGLLFMSASLIVGMGKLRRRFVLRTRDDR